MMMDKSACETPMHDHVERFWKYLETETVRILVDMRRDTSSVPYWDSSIFSDAVAKALVADRANTHQGREALDLPRVSAMETALTYMSVRAEQLEKDARYVSGSGEGAEIYRDAAKCIALALALAQAQEPGPTAEDIYACAQSTLIGFRDDLSEDQIKFICDQISRKATMRDDIASGAER